MASCLGIYIENNIIKYAKVSKDKDKIKVESFGVNFYDKLEDAIKQVIDETGSYKIPISINLLDETYNYFEMFSLLNKKDLEKAISTEFESFCTERGYNSNAFLSRYAATNSLFEREKLKIIHVSTNKIDFNREIQQFAGYRLMGIYPEGISIADLADFDEKENAIIINIEEKVTITTIYQQKVYDVKTLDIGSHDFLTKIQSKENSLSKAYEICKETTIYTSEGKDITEEQATYLEDIMPTLYEIVGQTKKILNESEKKIDNVYITGTAALINNIDLYFEEYLEDVKCQVLKPDFIKMTPDTNIKDYIEVNSAISLALMNLGRGIEGMNFKSNSAGDQLKNLLKVDINPEQKGKAKSKSKASKLLLTNDLSEPLDNTERALLRVVSSLVILFVVYTFFSTLLNKQMDAKGEEANTSISSTNSQIALAKADDEKIKAITNNYSSMIKNLQEINDQIAERNKTKKAIPNLLTAIMYNIPEGVQVTSIENTSGTKIEIVAQSEKYEQLGFFEAQIENQGVLTNVVSSAGQKENNVVTVKIEGELP